MKKVIATILVAIGLLVISTPAEAIGGCGKGTVSCRSTYWYNLYHR